MADTYLKHRLPVTATPERKSDLLNLTHVEVEVYYMLNGKRGLWVSVTPIQLEKTESGFLFSKFEVGAGCRHFRCPLNRKSSKDGKNMARTVLNEIENKDGTAWDMIQKVLTDENLVLEEKQAA